MKQKTVYYAHAMCTYGSAIERMDISNLEAMGFKVTNPNDPEIQKRYKVIEDWLLKSGNPMKYYWEDLSLTCDVFAFRSLPGGKIPSGVAAGLTAARNAGMPIIELPAVGDDRFLSYQQTKDYFLECGFYK